MTWKCIVNMFMCSRIYKFCIYVWVILNIEVMLIWLKKLRNLTEVVRVFTNCNLEHLVLLWFLLDNLTIFMYYMSYSVMSLRGIRKAICTTTVFPSFILETPPPPHATWMKHNLLVNLWRRIQFRTHIYQETLSFV